MTPARMTLFIHARPHRYTTWPVKQPTWGAEQEKNNTNTEGRKTSQHEYRTVQVQWQRLAQRMHMQHITTKQQFFITH
jgi:hypothetical protein